VNERGHLPPSEVATLRAAGVSDQEIVEVIATVAVNIFTNYFDHIAGTEIDFPVVHAAERAAR
jgi:alkylhydroperoxidase family enzyme